MRHRRVSGLMFLSVTDSSQGPSVLCPCPVLAWPLPGGTGRAGRMDWLSGSLLQRPAHTARLGAEARGVLSWFWKPAVRDQLVRRPVPLGPSAAAPLCLPGSPRCPLGMHPPQSLPWRHSPQCPSSPVQGHQALHTGGASPRCPQLSNGVCWDPASQRGGSETPAGCGLGGPSHPGEGVVPLGRPTVRLCRQGRPLESRHRTRRKPGSWGRGKG